MLWPPTVKDSNYPFGLLKSLFVPISKLPCCRQLRQLRRTGGYQPVLLVHCASRCSLPALVNALLSKNPKV